MRLFNHLFSIKDFLEVIAVLVGVHFFGVPLVRSMTGIDIAPAMTLVWIAFVMIWSFAFWRADSEYHRIRYAIAEHAPTLAKRKRELITHDAYGAEDDADWQQEVNRFAINVLKLRGQTAGDAIRDEVERAIARLPEKATSDDQP